MPIISKVGSRSFKVRFVYGMIFLVLILGAVVMVYPFMLMLVGSTKSESDLTRIAPYPQFWFDNQLLFQKYVESKYNSELVRVQDAWAERVSNWRNITRPKPSEYLDDFLIWRATAQCRWWSLGHIGGGGKLLPKNSREFRKKMYVRFDGDIQDFNKATGLPLTYWSAVFPPPANPLRYPPEKAGLDQIFYEYARQQPICDRIVGNPDGMFWNQFLRPQYTDDIDNYNRRHETHYTDYSQVFLAETAPVNPQERDDWEQFVRQILPLEYIRLRNSASRNFQSFLRQKYGTIRGYLRDRKGCSFSSFDEIPFNTVLPTRRIDQVDWQEFIADRQYCPTEAIEVYGPRQSFEEFLSKRHHKTLEDIQPVRLPTAQADWHDCIQNKGSLRWEFTTRNFKHVLDYLLIHGRGIPNTLIYCALAIGLSLIVNPLAAYALSRYKPPSTYTVLLFCLATMAFPTEVTMIPSFLLLKRFPLWPLVGGTATFGIVIWLLYKYLHRLPELLRATLAVGAALTVGIWLAPAVTGKPHISLLNTFAALVMPTMANGYMIFLLKGFFDSLPRELYEAADLDGAGEWTKFWSFTMALSKPILAVLALQTFIMAYTNFMMALIIIPDPKMWTMMVWLFQLQSESHVSVQYASIAIAAVPTFLIFIACQRVIIRGIVVPTEK